MAVQFRVVHACIVTSSLVSCHQDPLANYRPIERPYVERAVYLYSSHGKISQEQVFKMVKPVVVYLPHMICVGMNLRKGWAGGDVTVCFDEHGREVVRYRNGQ